MEKRQRLRLKAPDNWVNDPNGFIYFKGHYHLFYQYFPYGPRWGTMHWGHAVSQDLITWEHKGLALYPTTYGDQNGCFSGSAVEEDGKLYLVYTGVRYEVINPEDSHTCLDEQFESCQMLIASEDGFHFDNQNGKEVIIPPITDAAVGDRTHTRDPKVWRGSDEWYLIVGSTIEEKHGEVLFYKSKDLHHWTYVNQAMKGPEYGWMWECPDYFSTQGGEVLLLSAMGLLDNGEKERNQSICFPVHFEEETCQIQIPDEYQFIDQGMDLYAPQTTLDAQGRRTMLAWVRMPEVTKEGWIGMFCSPRVVEMEDGHICFRLHPNVRDAYSKITDDVSQTHEDGYMAVFDLEEGEEVSIGGFRIRREGDRICTDRSRVYPDFAGAHLRSETPRLRGGFHVEALVDEYFIEVFINDGESVISNAVYGLKKEITASESVRIVLKTPEDLTQ
ncbi:MAG TPA: glycoside hydrolase family 32 protein [Candidatus Dorea gallistercoris]|uniref:beta-fructofuranosidase n=1 Tax=Candidatus Dorea gallistercoris TaxID=2838542 RepID=A0A9D1UE64_9FIRM|nr:glycoside hydrolase family 32 protein [Candidatus Dorea gallistercoris]